MMKIIRLISRLFVGALFTYSGFVKVVDPLGTRYKFGDYFVDGFNMVSLDSTSLVLAFIMCAIEFLLGVALLLNFRTKLTSWLALGFMVLFTPLTLYLALIPDLKSAYPQAFSKINELTDCGCFGDAVKLTNWETFWKNVIISFFVAILFWQRKNYHTIWSTKLQSIGLAVVALGTLLFEFHNYYHLPVIDYRPYKVGNYLPDGMKIPEGESADVYEVIYQMKNLKTQNEVEVTSTQYTNDSKYWDTNVWEILGASDEPVLVKKGYTPPVHLNIDVLEPDVVGLPQGKDVTAIIMDEERPVFWFAAYDLKEANSNALKRGNELAEFCKQNDYRFMALTGSAPQEIEAFKRELGLNFPFYFTDPITIKAMVRASPGLVVLKKGTVVAKYHYFDIPDIEDLKVYLDRSIEKNYRSDKEN